MDDRTARDRKLSNINYITYGIILGIPVLGLIIYLLYYNM